MPWCVRWTRETVNNGSPRSLAATEAAAPDFRSAILSRAARDGGVGSEAGAPAGRPGWCASAATSAGPPAPDGMGTRRCSGDGWGWWRRGGELMRPRRRRLKVQHDRARARTHARKRAPGFQRGHGRGQ